jgi:hypothetical protein
MVSSYHRERLRKRKKKDIIPSPRGKNYCRIYISNKNIYFFRKIKMRDKTPTLKKKKN